MNTPTPRPLVPTALLLGTVAFALGACAGSDLTGPPGGDRRDDEQALALFHAEADELINVNTAGLAELDTLPRIGPVLAARIVAHRQTAGPFAIKQDLMDVRGIGRSTFGGLEHRIGVGNGSLEGDGDGDCLAGDGLVDINTANAAQLDTLPGVGPVTARRIVTDRETRGPFAVPADITRIRGIGPGTLARLGGRITVGGDCQAPTPLDDAAPDDAPPPAPAAEVRKVHVNDGDLDELTTLPGVDVAAAQALVDHTQGGGVFVTLDEVEAVTGADTSAWNPDAYTLAAHRVYFTPFHEGGAGFAERNRAKTLPLRDVDGGAAEATANIVDAFVDLVRRTPDGGLIQIGIYGYSLRTPEHEALADAVERRGVRLQVSIDTSVKNSRGVPYSADEIAAFRRLEGDVEVRTLRYRSKTLHEKFAIFDGGHVMNGSANISTKANSRYAETRMVFWNDPGVTEAFEAEFERLWNLLGVEPE